MLPEQINVLALHPVLHGLIHVKKAFVICVGEVVEDRVPDVVLRDGQVLVAICVLVQLLLLEKMLGERLAINGDSLVLFIEQFDVLRLPLLSLLLTEEDEAAVAVNIDRNTLHDEALGDGRLHLADTTPFA